MCNLYIVYKYSLVKLLLNYTTQFKAVLKRMKPSCFKVTSNYSGVNVRVQTPGEFEAPSRIVRVKWSLRVPTHIQPTLHSFCQCAQCQNVMHPRKDQQGPLKKLHPCSFPGTFLRSTNPLVFLLHSAVASCKPSHIPSLRALLTPESRNKGVTLPWPFRAAKSQGVEPSGTVVLSHDALALNNKRTTSSSPFLDAKCKGVRPLPGFSPHLQRLQLPTTSPPLVPVSLRGIPGASFPAHQFKLPVLSCEMQRSCAGFC